VKHIRTFESASMSMELDAILNIAKDEGLCIVENYVTEYCTWITIYRYDVEKYNDSLGNITTGLSDYVFDRKKEFLKDKPVIMEQIAFCDLIDNMFDRFLFLDESSELRCRYYQGSPNMYKVASTKVEKGTDRDINVFKTANIDIIDLEITLHFDTKR